MVARNTRMKIEEIFLRYGEVPLGKNSQVKPSLKEIQIHTDKMSASLRSRLNEDDVMSLGDSYGDPTTGDPVMYDFLRIKTKDGRIKEIEVYNLAIAMFMDNRDETRRLFRIINEIKGEQGTGGNGE